MGKFWLFLHSEHQKWVLFYQNIILRGARSAPTKNQILFLQTCYSYTWVLTILRSQLFLHLRFKRLLEFLRFRYSYISIYNILAILMISVFLHAISLFLHKISLFLHDLTILTHNFTILTHDLTILTRTILTH